jgi:type IV pilus assembly protein PilA
MDRQRNRRGFSLMELLIVVAIIMLISAIAMKPLRRALMSGHETAALGEIRALHQAETQYYSQFGKYAGSLSQLGPPASGAAGEGAADIIPGDLAAGKMGGYVFTVAATPIGYAIAAVPEAFGGSGGRTFYSDQTLVIRNNWSQEPANVNSPEIGSSAK